MEKTSISARQFFVAMFVSQVLVTIALGAQFTGGENILDSIFSYLLAMAVGLAVALPIGWSQRGGRSVPELAMDGLGRAGAVVPLAYCLYFVIAGGSSLALFEIFLMDTVNPGFSAGLVVAALLGVALYGAMRGIETVGRCATCVLVVLLLGCGLVFGIVAARFSGKNLEPVFYHGFGQTKQGVALFLARTSVFADMAVLLPQVKGRKALGFAGWMAGTAGFISLTILLIAGCLGRYAYTQNFPVYVLASLTEVRSLQRLDAVFTGVWIMGLIIKLAVDLYACRVCFAAISKKRRRWPVCLAAGGMLLLALLGAAGGAVQALLMDEDFLALCTLLSGLALPVIAWAAAALRGKGKGGGAS